MTAIIYQYAASTLLSIDMLVMDEKEGAPRI